jgi:hypothetical protein
MNGESTSLVPYTVLAIGGVHLSFVLFRVWGPRWSLSLFSLELRGYVDTRSPAWPGGAPAHGSLWISTTPKACGGGGSRRWQHRPCVADGTFSGGVGLKQPIPGRLFDRPVLRHLQPHELATQQTIYAGVGASTWWLRYTFCSSPAASYNLGRRCMLLQM